MTDNSDDTVLATFDAYTFSPVDDYLDLEVSMSTEARNRLEKIIHSARTGLVSIAPLICKGNDCPFIQRCPLFLESGAQAPFPTGRQCLVEVGIARQWFHEYAAQHGEQAVRSPTTRSLLSKLAELDTYEWRVSNVLAGVAGESDGTLLIDQTIAYDEQTNAQITQKQEHPAWKIKERIQKQRMEILDALAITPKRQIWADATLKRATNDNSFTKTMKTLERIDHLIEALEKDD